MAGAGKLIVRYVRLCIVVLFHIASYVLSKIHLQYCDIPSYIIGLRKLRLALVQLAVGGDKAANLTRAEGLVREAAQNGANIISLPVHISYNRTIDRSTVLPCRNVSTARTVPAISLNMLSPFPDTPQIISPSSPRSARFISLEVRCLLSSYSNNYCFSGSIPERENDKIYNTCAVFGPKGDLLGKYRKVSLLI